MFAGKNINEKSIRKLAESAELCWQAIQNRDTSDWGKTVSQCFDAQLEMFPAMVTEEILAMRDKYRSQVCGCKMTGSGGGGYMILISEKPVPNALEIVPGTL